MPMGNWVRPHRSPSSSSGRNSLPSSEKTKSAATAPSAAPSTGRRGRFRHQHSAGSYGRRSHGPSGLSGAARGARDGGRASPGRGGGEGKIGAAAVGGEKEGAMKADKGGALEWVPQKGVQVGLQEPVAAVVRPELDPRGQELLHRGRAGLHSFDDLARVLALAH